MSLHFDHEGHKTKIIRLLDQFQHVDSFHKEHDEMGEAVHSRNLRKIYNEMHRALDETYKQYPKEIEKYRKGLSNEDIFPEEEQNVASPGQSFVFPNDGESNHMLIIGKRGTGKTFMVRKILEQRKSSSKNHVIWVSNTRKIPILSAFSVTLIHNTYGTLSDKVKEKVAHHYDEYERIFVVFDKVILRDDIYKYVITEQNPKVQCFLLDSYPQSKIAKYIPFFRYVVAFQETNRENIHDLYKLFLGRDGSQTSLLAMYGAMDALKPYEFVLYDVINNIVTYEPRLQ